MLTAYGSVNYICSTRMYLDLRFVRAIVLASRLSLSHPGSLEKKLIEAL